MDKQKSFLTEAGLRRVYKNEVSVLIAEAFSILLS